MSVGGGGGGGKYATMASVGGFGRYTSVVDRYTPGMVRYGSRSDRMTPSEEEELETAFNSCRSFLLSRLKAAEVLGRRQRRRSSSSSSSVDDDDAIGGGGGGCPGPAQPTTTTTTMPPLPIGECSSVNFAFEQIRAKLLDLIETDIRVVRQLLNVGQQLEEIKWQRNYAGGGRGGGGSTSVDMSLADIESVDLDPYVTYFASSNKRLEDDVINADDADDVFQNDDTGGSRTKTTCSVQSNELRLTLTRSGNGVKVNSSDIAGSSKPRLMPGNSKSLNKLTKVEFQVSGVQERGNKSIPKSQNDFTTAKENKEAAATETQQEVVPGRKEEEKKTKSTAAALALRLVVAQRNNESHRNGQQQQQQQQRPSSRHEQPQHNNNNNAQLPSEANRSRRLNGSNANRTTEDTKSHIPSPSSSASFSSSSSFASHQLRPGVNQSQILLHRQIKTEESRRAGESVDDSSTANVVITHL